jgi:hypothetical protein
MLAASVLASASAAEVTVTLHGLEPMALPPGKPTRVRCLGDNLQGVIAAWTSFGSQVVPGIGSSGPPPEVSLRLPLPLDATTAIGVLRLVTTNVVSTPAFLMLDPLPTSLAPKPSHTIAEAPELQVPGAIESHCSEAADNWYRFRGQRGQDVTIEVVAARLGSVLDPVLQLLDARGRELAYCEDAPGFAADAWVRCRLPAEGTYFLKVRDSRYQGSPRYRYRLRAGRFDPQPTPFVWTPATAAAGNAVDPARSTARIQEREPNEHTGQATQVTLPAVVQGSFQRAADRDVFAFSAAANDRWVFSGRSRALGSACDLSLQLRDAQGTVLATAAGTGADDASLTNTFPTPGVYYLVIEELTGRGGAVSDYEVSLQPFQPAFTLALETERLTVAPGAETELAVTATRYGYNGPILLAAEGLGAGFTFTNTSLAGSTNKTSLRLRAPADATPGRLFHFRVVGDGSNSAGGIRAIASTRSAWRNLFPLLLYPPPELDSWIALGIAAANGEAR